MKSKKEGAEGGKSAVSSNMLSRGGRGKAMRKEYTRCDRRVDEGRRRGREDREDREDREEGSTLHSL